MSTNEEQETYDFYICGTDAIDAARGSDVVDGHDDG